MKFFRIILFIAAACLCSCPCATDLGNGIVEPDKFASVVFVNSIQNTSSVRFSDKYDDTLAIVPYNGVNYSKVKVPAEIENFIAVRTPDSTRLYYLSPVVLKDGANMTFIAFGDSLTTGAVLLNDTIVSYSANNVYIRVVNLFPGSDGLKVAGRDNFPVNATLAYLESSSIITAYSGKSGLDIVSQQDGSVLNSISDYDFRAGNLYVVILRPNPSGNSSPSYCIVNTGNR